MRTSNDLLSETVEAYESLYREHNVSFDASTFARVNDLDLVEHLQSAHAKSPIPSSLPTARSMDSFDALSRLPRLALPQILDRPNSPTSSASSLASSPTASSTRSPPSTTAPSESDHDALPDLPAAGTAYRTARGSADAFAPVTPIAGAPTLSALPATDAFAADWNAHLQRRFLLKVGNARLPTVVVCGHMCLADDGGYVYVLALRERVDERDPQWINLCLDLEDMAVLHAGVDVEIVQTVGWIEDL